MAALDIVSLTNFQAFVFDVETRTEETALQLFNALLEQHNSRHADEKSEISFAKRRKIGSYFPCNMNSGNSPKRSSGYLGWNNYHFKMLW
jgi:hypothetical protein